MNIIYFNNSYYYNNVKFEVLVTSGITNSEYNDIYIGCSDKHLPLEYGFGIEFNQYMSYINTAIDWFIDAAIDNGDWD